MRSSRSVLAVILSAGLLAMAGVSGTVAAHNPGEGFPPGHPGTSAKPLPSGWAWPSDLGTFVLKSHPPKPTEKPEPTKSPHPTPTVTCPPASTASSSSASSAAAMLQKGQAAEVRESWAKLIDDWRGRFQAEWAKQYCSIGTLRSALDRQIGGSTQSLQGLIGQVGGIAGLSASDKAAIDGELNSLIADLGALKTKVDGETTLAALQADLATLNGKAHLYRTVGQWVRLIVGAEKAIAAGPGLIALENTIAGLIAAAPPGPEITDAQTHLDNMKLAVTEGEGLAGPLPATLLAITPAQLASGAADLTLAKVSLDLFRANWDLQLARWSAGAAQYEIKEATATPKPKATPTPVASPTPV
jgi:hypothetical protein